MAGPVGRRLGFESRNYPFRVVGDYFFFVAAVKIDVELRDAGGL
jgi:hypothetical protein